MLHRCLILFTTGLLLTFAAAVAAQESGEKAAAGAETLGPRETVAGTITLVVPEKKLLVVTTAKGAPLNFILGPATRIRAGQQRLKPEDLAGRLNQKVSVTFVPTRRGNLARTVEVGG